jgi:hypothetical protein
VTSVPASAFSAKALEDFVPLFQMSIAEELSSSTLASVVCEALGVRRLPEQMFDVPASYAL